MKKVAALGLVVGVMGIVSGCSGVSVKKPVSPQSKLAIVQFADCNISVLADCKGSGKKVSDSYAKVFQVPVISQEDSSKFDVLITGKVIDYNEAVPMAFRPNISGVELNVVDQKGEVLATQSKRKEGNNLFTSASGLSEDLASSLKGSLIR